MQVWLRTTTQRATYFVKYTVSSQQTVFTRHKAQSKHYIATYADLKVFCNAEATASHFTLL
jgi:hypothetical protein